MWPVPRPLHQPPSLPEVSLVSPSPESSLVESFLSVVQISSVSVSGNSLAVVQSYRIKPVFEQFLRDSDAGLDVWKQLSLSFSGVLSVSRLSYHKTLFIPGNKAESLLKTPLTLRGIRRRSRSKHAREKGGSCSRVGVKFRWVETGSVQKMLKTGCRHCPGHHPSFVFLRERGGVV